MSEACGQLSPPTVSDDHTASLWQFARHYHGRPGTAAENLPNSLVRLVLRFEMEDVSRPTRIRSQRWAYFSNGIRSVTHLFENFRLNRCLITTFAGIYPAPRPHGCTHRASRAASRRLLNSVAPIGTNSGPSDRGLLYDCQTGEAGPEAPCPF